MLVLTRRWGIFDWVQFLQTEHWVWVSISLSRRQLDALVYSHLPCCPSARNLEAKSWLPMGWPRKWVPYSTSLEIEPSIARARQRYPASLGDCILVKDWQRWHEGCNNLGFCGDEGKYQEGLQVLEIWIGTKIRQGRQGVAFVSSIYGVLVSAREPRLSLPV